MTKYQIVELNGTFKYSEKGEIEELCCLNCENPNEEELKGLNYDTFEEAWQELSKDKYKPVADDYWGNKLIKITEFAVMEYEERNNEYYDGANYDAAWNYRWAEDEGDIVIEKATHRNFEN